MWMRSEGKKVDGHHLAHVDDRLLALVQSPSLANTRTHACTHTLSLPLPPSLTRFENYKT